MNRYARRPHTVSHGRQLGRDYMKHYCETSEFLPAKEYKLRTAERDALWNRYVHQCRFNNAVWIKL